MVVVFVPCSLFTAGKLTHLQKVVILIIVTNNIKWLHKIHAAYERFCEYVKALP